MATVRSPQSELKICIPVPDALSAPPGRRGADWVRTLAGAVGVIDNSKPGFEALARAAVAEMTSAGSSTDDALYTRKPTATRGAAEEIVDRLAAGAVAVLVGSGD